MFECKNCGLMFEEADCSLTSGGDIGEPWAVCPHCGDDDYIEIEQCSCCGDWIDVDDLKAGLCENCFEKKASNEGLVVAYGEKNPIVVQVNALYAVAFSDRDINDILQKAFQELPKNKQRECMGNLCLDDVTAFVSLAEIC